MKTRWVIQVLLLLGFFVGFLFFRDAYGGYVSAQMAIEQLNSSAHSLVPLTAYKYVSNAFGFLFLVMLTATLMFEISSYNKEKEMNNEKE